jgi:hypothetical protein
MKRSHALLTIALLLCGCRAAPPQAAAPTYPDLRIARLTYPDHAQDVSLLASYGYVIDWRSDTQPTFYVFNRPRHQRLRTRSWTTFLVALAQIPNDSTVDAVDQCSAPFSAGIPPTHADVLDTVIIAKHLHRVLPSDPLHVELCTCETKSCDLLFDVEK